MCKIMNEKAEDNVLVPEISYEALEKAACAEPLGAVTQFANCTFMGCPD